MCHSDKYENYMRDCIKSSNVPCLDNPHKEFEKTFKGLDFCVFYSENYEEAKNIVHNKVKKSTNLDYDIDVLIEEQIKEMFLLYNIKKSISSNVLNFKFKNTEENKKLIIQEVQSAFKKYLNTHY